jgi:hypothetical protein
MMSSTLSVTEVSQIRTQTTFVVGADIGNLHARIVWGESETDRKMIESYILPIASEEGLTNVFSLLSSTASESEWIGKAWLVGADAVAVDAVSGDRVMDAIDGKAKLALPLLSALLWNVLPVSGAVIKLCISVHDTTALGNKVRANLNGRHTVTKDGVQKTFTIELIEVYAEGVGVVRYSKPESKAIFLADFGSDTLIGSAFTGYTAKCSPWAASAYGVRSLIQAVMSCSETSASLGRVATFEEIIYSLENPKGKKYFVGKVDITSAVECEAEKWLEHGLKNLERSMKSAIQESKVKLATGGGCAIPQVKKALEFRGYSVVTQPVWANVSGLYEIAQKKAAK